MVTTITMARVTMNDVPNSGRRNIIGNLLYYIACIYLFRRNTPEKDLLYIRIFFNIYYEAVNVEESV